MVRLRSRGSNQHLGLHAGYLSGVVMNLFFYEKQNKNRVPSAYFSPFSSKLNEVVNKLFLSCFLPLGPPLTQACQTLAWGRPPRVTQRAVDATWQPLVNSELRKPVIAGLNCFLPPSFSPYRLHPASPQNCSRLRRKSILSTSLLVSTTAYIIFLKPINNFKKKRGPHGKT